MSRTGPRFAVGDSVWCFLGQAKWVKGRVQGVQIATRAGVMPYEVLAGGDRMFAPEDSDACIRKALESECLWDAPKDTSNAPMLPSDGAGGIDSGRVSIASDSRERLQRLRAAGADSGIFVCQARSCRASGSEAVLREIEELARDVNCIVQPSGCLGACNSAPNVAVVRSDPGMCFCVQ